MRQEDFRRTLLCSEESGEEDGCVHTILNFGDLFIGQKGVQVDCDAHA
jgi:hypothetical protein